MEPHELIAYNIQDFESKAQELIHIMLMLCEARLHGTPLNPPVANALTKSVLAVKSSIKTFVLIERLNDE